MDKIKSGYKSASNIYDNYITSGNLFFKLVSKIIWGFEDKNYSIKLLEIWNIGSIVCFKCKKGNGG
jgi:hypothetical protein